MHQITLLSPLSLCRAGSNKSNYLDIASILRSRDRCHICTCPSNPLPSRKRLSRSRLHTSAHENNEILPNETAMDKYSTKTIMLVPLNSLLRHKRPLIGTNKWNLKSSDVFGAFFAWLGRVNYRCEIGNKLLIINVRFFIVTKVLCCGDVHSDFCCCRIDRPNQGDKHDEFHCWGKIIQHRRSEQLRAVQGKNKGRW